MMLFNSKEILVGGKPIFISEWLNCNILFTQDLLNSNGQFMSYQEFDNRYAYIYKKEKTAMINNGIPHNENKYLQ